MFKVFMEFLDGSRHSILLYAGDQYDAMRIASRRHSHDLYSLRAEAVTVQIHEIAPLVYAQLERAHV
jgi:hypothetical protein